MSAITLWGSGNKGRSSNVTAQRRINLFSESYQGLNEDKGPFVLYSRPGLARKYFLGDNSVSSFPGGPFRGIITQQTSVSGGAGEIIYGVQNAHGCLATSTSRFLTGSDYIATRSGPVQFASLGLQTMFVDGVTGYIPANGTTMQQEGVTDFPAASSVCTLAQRFIVNDPTNAGRFRWSDVGTAFSWPALNFATAESNPDPLSLVFVARGELLLFGSLSLEFWAPSGDSSVFARIGGSGVDWGLAYFDTVRNVGDTTFFVGRGQGGQAQVCRINGYQVVPVSTPDIAYDIAQEVALGAVPTATTLTYGGHSWYILNLLNTSFAYDLTTRDWSEWQTDGKRWAGQYTTIFNGLTLITDYRNGKIYVPDIDSYADDGQSIVRQVETRHVAQDLDRISVSSVALDMETGVTTAVPELPTCVTGGSACRQTTNNCATTTAGFTVEGWVMCNDLASPSALPQGVIKKTVPAGSDWSFEFVSGPALRFFSTSGFNVQIALSASDSSTPFHFAFAYDSVAQTLTAYKNGVQQAQTTAVTDMGGTANTSALYLGSRAGLFGLNGTVGGVRIWNGALSSATLLTNWQTRLASGTANMLSQWWDFPAGQIGSFINSGSAGDATIASVGVATTHIGYVVSLRAGNPQVMLQVSRDGGHTFGNELWTTLGAAGNYRTRVVWRRLGRARDFVFRFRVVDPVKAVFIGASMDASK